MMGWWSILLVGAGGLAGAIGRFYTVRNIGKMFPSVIPYGTLTVNLLGSFLLGFIAGSPLGAAPYLIWGTGFLGAFTTFSTLNSECLILARTGQKKPLIFYLAVTYTFGISLAFAGYYLSELMFHT